MSELPLSGVRVLDLTRAAAGPFCTMILADLGADVIKVEALPGGDLLRAFGPFVEGEGAYFLSINRNKRSVAIDFRSDEGRRILTQAAKSADTIVENFKPGITHQMGLDYETLAKENPRLIYASITGFGSSGPYGLWPGVDQIAQGMSGLMSLTGTPESGPIRVGIPIADLTAGMWTAIGILAAVIGRASTGKGQKVDTSLLGAIIGLLCVQGQRYLSLGEVAGPVANDHPVICPYGLFETRTGFINISVATQSMWASLCDALQLPELVDDPDFRDNTARLRNRDALRRHLNGAFGRDTQENWTRVLIQVGIPAGPVYSMDQVFEDPHVQAGGFVDHIQHPTIGDLPLLTLPARLQDLEGQTFRRPPPLLGQHSTEILGEFGIPLAEIDDLVRRKVVQSTSGSSDELRG